MHHFVNQIVSAATVVCGLTVTRLTDTIDRKTSHLANIKILVTSSTICDMLTWEPLVDATSYDYEYTTIYINNIFWLRTSFPSSLYSHTHSRKAYG